MDRYVRREIEGAIDRCRFGVGLYGSGGNLVFLCAGCGRLLGGSRHVFCRDCRRLRFG